MSSRRTAKVCARAPPSSWNSSTKRFRLLRRGLKVVDLGCAPGGWSQIAAQVVGPAGAVVGVDLSETDSLPGVTLLRGDFRDPETAAAIAAALGGPADLVLSDMAAPATGHAATDHLRIVALAEDAFAVAQTLLRPGGALSSPRCSRAVPRARCSRR